MSDVDPDLPEWLVDAVLSQEPPAEAVDLVKDAWTWRTIDAELMELTYDSVLDTAGVRDASARRTMEFTAGDISVVIEIDGRTIRGTATVPVQRVAAHSIQGRVVASLEPDSGVFVLEVGHQGAVVLRLDFRDFRAETPTFNLS